MTNSQLLKASSVSALLLCLAWPAIAQTGSGAGSQKPQEIVVLSALSDAEGLGQGDMNLDLLKYFEKITVSKLRAKIDSYLKSQGDRTEVPALIAESTYVEAKGKKLAVIRIRSKAEGVNSMFVYGINGSELGRVACTRVRNLGESIPLSYGPCGDKVREVFGVSLGL